MGRCWPLGLPAGWVAGPGGWWPPFQSHYRGKEDPRWGLRQRSPPYCGRHYSDGRSARQTTPLLYSLRRNHRRPDGAAQGKETDRWSTPWNHKTDTKGSSVHVVVTGFGREWSAFLEIHNQSVLFSQILLFTFWRSNIIEDLARWNLGNKPRQKLRDIYTTYIICIWQENCSSSKFAVFKGFTVNYV